MAVSKVASKDLRFLLDRLSGVIDLSKDLPANIFIGGGFLFWFFERPLLCFHEIFAGLISSSVASFESSVFIKFSGGEAFASTCFSVSGAVLEKDIVWLSKGFENFFDGAVGYPIVLCDSECNWVAFESAHEEFGVVAVRESEMKEGFYDYLNSSFISMDELAELASCPSADGKVAKSLVFSYRS